MQLREREIQLRGREQGLTDEAHELPMDAHASETLVETPSPSPMPHPVPVKPHISPEVTVPVDVRRIVTPKVTPPTIEVPVVSNPSIVTPPDHPNILHLSPSNISVREQEDNKFIATGEMEFVVKIQPGAALVVLNHVGKIELSPSQDGNCTVKAAIRATTEINEKALELVEQVSMHINSSSEKFYFEPVKKSGEDSWENLNVDLYITVPSNIPIDISTDVGSINASNVIGKINLTTQVGDIEFAAPGNLSARLQAITKVGSIESDFPMEIKTIDFTASQANGTIGSGENNIKLTTEVGKIRIRRITKEATPDFTPF